MKCPQCHKETEQLFLTERGQQCRECKSLPQAPGSEDTQRLDFLEKNPHVNLTYLRDVGWVVHFGDEPSLGYIASNKTLRGAIDAALSQPNDKLTGGADGQ